MVHWARRDRCHRPWPETVLLVGYMGTLWPPGQVTRVRAKSKVKSCLVKSGPTYGQGRAIMYTPCAAHGAIRGLAMYPGRYRVAQTWRLLQVSASSSRPHARADSLGGTTSRMTVLSRSTAKCSLKPLKVLALLLRPWRMSGSSIEIRRSGATCCLIRARWSTFRVGCGVLGDNLGDGVHDLLRGGCWAARVCCCASQCCHRATSSGPGPARVPARWVPPKPEPGGFQTAVAHQRQPGGLRPPLWRCPVPERPGRRPCAGHGRAGSRCPRPG